MCSRNLSFLVLFICFLNSITRVVPQSGGVRFLLDGVDHVFHMSNRPDASNTSNIQAIVDALCSQFDLRSCSDILLKLFESSHNNDFYHTTQYLFQDRIVYIKSMDPPFKLATLRLGRGTYGFHSESIKWWGHASYEGLTAVTFGRYCSLVSYSIG